jgi:hypothetical protein
VVSKAGDDLTVYGRLIPDLLAPLDAAVPGLRLAIESDPSLKRRRRRRRRRDKDRSKG